MASTALHPLDFITADQALELLRANFDIIDAAARPGAPTPRSLAEAVHAAGGTKPGTAAYIVMYAAVGELFPQLELTLSALQRLPRLHAFHVIRMAPRLASSKLVPERMLCGRDPLLDVVRQYGCVIVAAIICSKSSRYNRWLAEYG